jgi:hypothetical protein
MYILYIGQDFHPSLLATTSVEEVLSDEPLALIHFLNFVLSL